ncbi:MAG: tungstate ABC transporter substrate-binding protein WtpA [Bacteroidota bacterium]
MNTISPLRLIFLTLLVVTSFTIKAQKQGTGISGDLIIFHAGSLSVPFKDIITEFTKVYPNVKLLPESAGSVASARKITDLDRPCDIMASADYSVIDKMLIPKYADWNIKFASNEMAIVYTDKSRYSDKISSANWYETLMKPDVTFGRADPNSDPCGYRTVLALQLAEKYYKKPGLSKNMLGKNQEYMRPKEVDMVALLESGSIDYIFIYRSIAIQHKLKYVILPDQVNLKNPSMASLYATAKVEINGSKPGEKQLMVGEPMIYGVTILRDAPNRAAAEAFVAFMLAKNKGMKIMEKDGQPSVIPMPVQNYDKLPAILKPFATKK